jgi:hypothetical protein
MHCVSWPHPKTGRSPVRPIAVVVYLIRPNRGLAAGLLGKSTTTKAGLFKPNLIEIASIPSRAIKVKSNQVKIKIKSKNRLKSSNQIKSGGPWTAHWDGPVPFVSKQCSKFGCGRA